jgi:hypothetical protein
MAAAADMAYGAAPLGDSGGAGWGAYYAPGGGGYGTPAAAGFGGGSSMPIGSSPSGGGATGAAGGASGSGSSFMPSIQQLLSFMPQMFQAFGGVPTVNPSMIDPSSIGKFLTPYTNSVEQSLAPEFAQQDDALNTSLASRGIYNSSAGAQLQSQQGQQQQATVLGTSLPMANADLAANQGSQNSADFANAQEYGNVVNSNESMYNGFLNTLMQQGMGISDTMLGSYLGSFGANPQALGLLGTGLQGASSAYSDTYNQNMGWINSLMQALGGAAAAEAGK